MLAIVYALWHVYRVLCPPSNQNSNGRECDFMRRLKCECDAVAKDRVCRKYLSYTDEKECVDVHCVHVNVIWFVCTKRIEAKDTEEEEKESESRRSQQLN